MSPDRLPVEEQIAQLLGRVRAAHDTRLREVPGARAFAHRAWGLAFAPQCAVPGCICQTAVHTVHTVHGPPATTGGGGG